MIELFGKEYKFSSLIFPSVFLCSIVIVSLNIFYFIELDTNLMNMNMGIGFILLVYSAYNLSPNKY